MSTTDAGGTPENRVDQYLKTIGRLTAQYKAGEINAANFDIQADEASYYVRQLDSQVAALQKENAELRKAAQGMANLLCRARSDIWQTARVSESNLTGIDPVFPHDAPLIPKPPRLIHRQGIDESYRLIRDIESVSAAWAAQQSSTPQTGNGGGA